MIIFDNFDEFISKADMLHQFHAEAVNVKFLVTSRERLKISGEWVVEIQGLDYPESDSEKFDEILGFQAVELFISAARRTSSNFQIDADNCKEIVAIAQLVEGMPLGLEMAASWINLLSLKEILAEIRTNLDFLKSDMQDTPARQRSMRAVLDYSWMHLDSVDQSALARLSVFQGGFTREAAEKVAGVFLSDLKKFKDRSFIRQTGSGGFHIHELMRQYAHEKLCQFTENHNNAGDRHASYYCVGIGLWGNGLKGPDQIELLPVIWQEIDNIQSAWIWATQEKKIEQIKRGLEGLSYFYLRTLRNQEGLKACQLGLSALEETEAEGGQELRAKLLAWKSIFSLNLFDHESAGESINSALELIAEIVGVQDDLAPLQARMFMTKAIVENYLGNRESAIANYDQGFEIFRQIDDFSEFSYLMLRSLDIGGVNSEKIYQYLSEAINLKETLATYSTRPICPTCTV